MEKIFFWNLGDKERHPLPFRLLPKASGLLFVSFRNLNGHGGPLFLQPEDSYRST